MIKWLNLLKSEALDFWQFLKVYSNFLFWRGYRGFRVFESGKDIIARLLYRQRGRFSQPFLHAAMAGLTALGITLAPVLANSLPSSSTNELANQAPSQVIREITSDDTTTKESDKVRDTVQNYLVQPGYTVSKIAVDRGVDTDTIRWANNLSSVDDIKPGQSLRILPVSGVVHKVVRGETIFSIAKKYATGSQGIVDYPFNTFVDDETFSLAVGQELIVPDGKMPNIQPWSPTRYVAATTPNAGAVSATGRFIWPIGGTITQRFAWYHKGADIATAYGTPILAADAGRVVVAGWPANEGYGNRVMIDHGNGYTTLYAHMASISVSAGQTVNRGDKIGLEGSTGRSTCPHLHFEVRKNGVPVNPFDYLK